MVLVPDRESNIRAEAQRKAHDCGPVRILKSVFAVLDQSAIRYAVLHGSDRFETGIASDVDCVLDPAVTLKQLVRLLHQHRQRIGADVVRTSGFRLTLAGADADGTPCCLELDFAAGKSVDGIAFHGANDLLVRRIWRDGFWCLHPEAEFGSYLTRSIATGRLDDTRCTRLEALHRQCPSSCDAEAARFLSRDMARIVIGALQTGDWGPVLHVQDSLQAEMRARAIRRRPLRFAANRCASLASRLAQLWQPQGMSVVILGPDGAGKSSLIEALAKTAAPVFNRADCWGFAPPVRRLLGAAKTPTNTPHAQAPRPLVQSLLRTGYWFAFNTIGYVPLRIALARASLVLYDRHFIDIFVDPVRYRYGGPQWAINLVWRLMPKPDLVLLLNAAPEVIQARKQEVPVEVTARQLRDYLALMQTMPGSRIVDAGQHPEKVAADVQNLLWQYLAKRVARRAGVAALSGRRPDDSHVNTMPVANSRNPR